MKNLLKEKIRKKFGEIRIVEEEPSTIWYLQTSFRPVLTGVKYRWKEKSISDLVTTVSQFYIYHNGKILSLPYEYVDDIENTETYFEGDISPLDALLLLKNDDAVLLEYEEREDNLPDKYYHWREITIYKRIDKNIIDKAIELITSKKDTDVIHKFMNVFTPENL